MRLYPILWLLCSAIMFFAGSIYIIEKIGFLVPELKGWADWPLRFLVGFICSLLGVIGTMEFEKHCFRRTDIHRCGK